MNPTKTFIAISFLVTSSIANAGLVNWIDWDTSHEGSLTINGSTSNVSLTGTPLSLVEDQGAYGGHYNNQYTNYGSASGTFAGLKPTEFIQLYSSGTFTIDFGQTLINPYMSLISVGQPTLPVTYTFNHDFSVISSGPEHWVPTSYSYSQPSNNTLVGNEYSGILQFNGAFDSITFTTNKNENWHGFNFGAQSAAVPEPSILSLLGLGLLGLGFSKRNSKD